MRHARTLVVAVVAALVLTATAGAATAARGDGGAPRHMTPVTGAKFNNPLGQAQQRQRLYRYVLGAVQSVPRGGTIRGAMFSFAEQGLAEALVAAARRGVRVKMVIDGDRRFGSVNYLVRQLGTNTSKRSYVVLCELSCRGTAGQMHAKFFQFTKVGRAKKVTMVGSNNLTRHNSDQQWSDVYTQVGDLAYYRVFRTWFSQLRRDAPIADPYWQAVAGGHQITFTPLDLRTHPDPLIAALAPIGCTTATGRTVVRIGSSAWNGERGKLVARRVAELVAEGCDVRVVLGPGTGSAVRSILEDGGTPMTSGTHRGVYTHMKLLVVTGRYGAEDAASRVFTGSQNWSDRALRRDDILVGITSPEIGRQYAIGFDRMWRLG